MTRPLPDPERIRRLAAVSVLRGLGFCCLAIGLVVAGMAFDPALAFRAGAIMMLGLAIIMKFKADTYHRKRRIDESEVWAMIPPAERPSKDEARRLIVPAMRRELTEKALWAVWMALGCVALSAGWLLAAP